MQSFDYIQKYQNAKNAKEFSACAGPCVRISVHREEGYKYWPVTCMPRR